VLSILTISNYKCKKKISNSTVNRIIVLDNGMQKMLHLHVGFFSIGKICSARTLQWDKQPKGMMYKPLSNQLRHTLLRIITLRVVYPTEESLHCVSYLCIKSKGTRVDRWPPIPAGTSEQLIPTILIQSIRD